MKIKRWMALILALTLLTALSAVPASAKSTMTLKTTGSVYLRKGAGTNYAKVATAANGATLTYLGVSIYSSGGTLWHKVAYRTGSAWISSVYAVVTVDGLKLNNKVYVQATASVNLRKGPSANYAKVTSVSKGKKLFYMGVTNVDQYGRKWYKVSSSKGIAWMTSRYSHLSTDPYSGKEIITTGNVYLRKGPNTSYAEITVIPKGFVCPYLDRYAVDKYGTKWYRVNYKGMAGWISSKYAKFY